MGVMVLVCLVHLLDNGHNLFWFVFVLLSVLVVFDFYELLQTNLKGEEKLPNTLFFAEEKYP